LQLALGFGDLSPFRLNARIRESGFVAGSLPSGLPGERDCFRGRVLSIGQFAFAEQITRQNCFGPGGISPGA